MRRPAAGRIAGYSTVGQRPGGDPGRTQGVDVGGPLPGDRLPAGCLRRRHRAPGLALRRTPGPGAGGPRHAAGRDPHGRGPLAARPHGRHRRVGARASTSSSCAPARATRCWSRTWCPRRRRTGTVALVAPITTWQAYNEWGGYSLYHGPEGDRRSYAVSFDRPYNGATGANDYRTAAVPIIVRAEELGIPLSYFTNVDLHTTPGLLEGASGYVSMGHDEYWTTTMRVGRHRGARRRDEPRLPRREHDVLAGPPGGPGHRPGPGRRRVPVRRRPRPPARRRAPRGHGAVPRRADAQPRAGADRDDVRVLPGRHRLRRRLAAAGGDSAEPASPVGTGSPDWSARRPTGSTRPARSRARCRSSATRRTPAVA